MSDDATGPGTDSRGRPAAHAGGRSESPPATGPGARPGLRMQTRLVFVTTLVLVVFLTFTGLVLDRSFTVSTLTGAEEQMRLVTYSLMGSAQSENGRIAFRDLPEPRLLQPESGLYAAVSELGGDFRWRSPSARTSAVDFPERQAPFGEFHFEDDDESARFLLTTAVIWESADESTLIFQVAADRAPFVAAIRSFRQSLYAGLALVTLVVFAVQIVAIRWGLKPLRIMAEEVRELEEGRREELSSAYPGELQGLADNLGRFAAHEQRSRARYRNALDDLAHSLKTPLAVLRNAVTSPPRPDTEDPALLAEQLDRMENAMHRQLSRATVAGPSVVARRVDLDNLVRRLGRALETAYRQRAITLQMELPAGLGVRGDERDFMDLFGNLLENAFKYTHSRVRVTASGGECTMVRIDDDGPGIDPDIREQVIDRGIRADRVEPGQGIGLAVVAELTAAYNGSLQIGSSPLGGARVEVKL